MIGQAAAIAEAPPPPSRDPRTKVLLTAQIFGDGGERAVRIRNMSATGALIDGLEIAGDGQGLDVLIELLEDQMFAARVRWARDGKAGIEFAEHFNLERLSEARERGIRRLAG